MNGDTPNDAWEKAKGQYGRVDDAAKIIDPRKEYIHRRNGAFSNLNKGK